MSYILDALARSKAERERGTVDASHQPAPPPLIPAGEPPARQGSGSGLAWAFAAVALGALAAGAWQYREPVLAKLDALLGNGAPTTVAEARESDPPSGAVQRTSTHADEVTTPGPSQPSIRSATVVTDSASHQQPATAPSASATVGARRGEHGAGAQRARKGHTEGSTRPLQAESAPEWAQEDADGSAIADAMLAQADPAPDWAREDADEATATRRDRAARGARNSNNRRPRSAAATGEVAANSNEATSSQRRRPDASRAGPSDDDAGTRGSRRSSQRDASSRGKPARERAAQRIKAAEEENLPPDIRALPAATRTGVPNYRINALVYADAPDERMAIVNLRRYGEGDTTRDGSTIERITPRRVVFDHQGTRFTVSLPR